MKVKIERTAREVRQDRNGNDCTGVMFGGEWYSMAGDQRKLYNKTVDVEVKGKWARLIQATASPNGHKPQTDKIKMADYESAMRAFHQIAHELEPDDAQARVSLVQTALVALREGAVELPAASDEQGNGAPIDDDIPF